MAGATSTSCVAVGARLLAAGAGQPPDHEPRRFARCWPGAGRGQRFTFVRLIEIGDEVLVTYELGLGQGRRGRNTQVLGFRGERIRFAEVYVGWEPPEIAG